MPNDIILSRRLSVESVFIVYSLYPGPHVAGGSSKAASLTLNNACVNSTQLNSTSIYGRRW